MRNFVLSLLAMTVLSVQAQVLKVNVKIETGNVPERVMVTLVNPNDNTVKNDTIKVQDASFSLAYPSEVAQVLTVRSFVGGRNGAVLLGNMLLVPNQAAEVVVSEDRVSVKGGPFYEEMEKCAADLTELTQELTELSHQYYALNNDKSAAAEAKRKELEEKGRELQQVVDKQVQEYAMANKNKAGVVFLIVSQLSDPMSYIDGLSDNIRHGVLEGYLNAVQSAIVARQEGDVQQKRPEENLKPGMMAPDFTLKDINGKPLALSSLRGKYVVLDFWGTWCIWCIRGVPMMKEYYEKYSSKMEILGIDCGDTEDVWKKGVERHQLPWKHVYNPCGTAGDINPLYRVEGFPTKAIIDPEGKLVKIFIGESEEFYQMLDELLK